jgi:hypothetical protein
VDVRGTTAYPDIGSTRAARANEVLRLVARFECSWNPRVKGIRADQFPGDVDYNAPGRLYGETGLLLQAHLNHMPQRQELPG